MIAKIAVDSCADWAAHTTLSVMSLVQEISKTKGGLMQLDSIEEEMPFTQVKAFSKEPEYQKNRPPSFSLTSKRRSVL